MRRTTRLKCDARWGGSVRALRACEVTGKRCATRQGTEPAMRRQAAPFSCSTQSSDPRARVKTSTRSVGPPDARPGKRRAILQSDSASAGTWLPPPLPMPDAKPGTFEHASKHPQAASARPTRSSADAGLSRILPTEGRGGCVIKCINPMRRYNQPDRHGIFMTDQIRCRKVVSVPFVMRKTRVHFPAADAKAKTIHKTNTPRFSPKSATLQTHTLDDASRGGESTPRAGGSGARQANETHPDPRNQTPNEGAAPPNPLRMESCF